jgi:tripartite-type tricarboxylate transporter receptor subunit TctC
MPGMRQCEFVSLFGGSEMPCCKFLHLVAVGTLAVIARAAITATTIAVALPIFSGLALGQSYPTKPIHLIVGYPPGGANDTVARLMAPWLSGRLGQPVVIENRPGAGNNIATEAVVRAPADGHTLLIVDAANAINATFYEKLNFNFIRDIAPVASIMDVPLVMEVNTSIPPKTVAEFIAYAKANPDKISMASAGNGHPTHVAGELFKKMTGTELIHVPYRGGAQALTDLLGGQVQVYFGLLPASIEYVRAGRLRALAVTTEKRSQALPNLPTVGEFVPGYEASSWFGVGAPKNTPTEIIEKLNKEINAFLADSKSKTRLADLGGTVVSLSPDDFGKLITEETEKWGNVIRDAKIKAGLPPVNTPQVVRAGR